MIGIKRMINFRFLKMYMAKSIVFTTPTLGADT